MMSNKRIYFETNVVEVKPDETVLDGFVRSGVSIPFSCRGGSCQTCAVRCLEGDIPADAQLGLSDYQKEKGYILTCRCIPTTDMTIAPLSPDDVITDAFLMAVEQPTAAHPKYRFTIELGRSRKFEIGDTFKIIDGTNDEPVVKVVATDGDWVLTVELLADTAPATLTWLQGELQPDTMIQIRGPYSQQIPMWLTEEKPDPEPNLEVWHQLDDGAKVRTVLIDFYDRVYEDERLAPFFANVSKTRLVEKQFSFMKYLFTREHVHFGQRPRNLHHWMVISDDLMDHRRTILDDTFKDHGLTDEQRHVWHQYEEKFRQDVVKDKPWPIKVGDEFIDLEAFDKEVLSCATVCDHCGEPVDEGTEVIYHRRTGKISCPSCSK
ncbi:2Fe-2S iron-sulfur cluster-binding protein [Entomomonas asaccharolytica]|uniref:2Fe-2S iron-sulfur cluster binding domain-containing protein n=1 Tax=Entomomonas asaccharolytica TaxID=2785331 RepID=A0A974RZE2_9GAMM|nr:2Fe-2S iron-sulfur cluster-binding protein [Entomomonas asaccharolytica]QQP86989.1 2Fe-2S iron-sulfur cluster binding domain-containing protein [Entomomonas asaccharolytica]